VGSPRWWLCLPAPSPRFGWSAASVFATRSCFGRLRQDHWRLPVAPGATPCQGWTARVLVKDQLRRGNGMPDSGVVSRGLHAEDERAVGGQRHDPVMSSAEELPLPWRPPSRTATSEDQLHEAVSVGLRPRGRCRSRCLNGDSSIDDDAANYTAVSRSIAYPERHRRSQGRWCGCESALGWPDAGRG
jgi:hypothetical protein